MTKRTNTEFIDHSMNYSRNGALAQAWLIDALIKQADAVIKQKDELIKEGHPFVSMKAWVDCSEEFKEKLYENYQ